MSIFGDRFRVSHRLDIIVGLDERGEGVHFAGERDRISPMVSKSMGMLRVITIAWVFTSWTET